MRVRSAVAVIAAVLAVGVGIAGPPAQQQVVGFADGPTPIPRVEPPRVRPVSFAAAMQAYLRGAVSVIERADGGLRFIDCPDKIQARLVGDEAALATAMVDRIGSQLAVTLSPMHADFSEWYHTAGVSAASPMTPAELTGLYQWYVMTGLTGEQADGLRPYVADVVIAAGLPRAADLMVTPAVAARGPVSGDASCRCFGQPCTCPSGHTCSCQMSAPNGYDCAPPSANCNVDDAPEPKIKVGAGR